MKTIKHILISFLFFFYFSINAQQRNVDWVHGLGGNTSSWAYYEQIFNTERNINSLNLYYDTSTSIDYSANQVRNGVMNYWYDAYNNRNLAIGHSMGGLMIRDVDRYTAQNNKVFGGYITVCTPNYGAGIANSILDGSVQDAAVDAMNKITDGPLSQLFGLPYTIIPNLTTDLVGNLFIDNNIINNMISNGYPTPIVQDLKQGSNTIDAINYYTDNYNQDIPRISVWGNETSPVHWQMLSFELYNNDQQLPNYMITARNVYHVAYITNLSVGAACTFAGFFNPWCFVSAANFYYIASQWKKGRDWFDDSENIWNSLIKTTRREQREVQVLVFVPDDDYDDCMSYYENEQYPWPGDCGEWVYQTVTRWVNINYPSDGLIPKYSQIMQNNPTQNNEYEVPGANHLGILNMQASNNGDDIMKSKFDDIFDRNDWFGTN